MSKKATILGRDYTNRQHRGLFWLSYCTHLVVNVIEQDGLLLGSIDATIIKKLCDERHGAKSVTLLHNYSKGSTRFASVIREIYP